MSLVGTRESGLGTRHSRVAVTVRRCNIGGRLRELRMPGFYKSRDPSPEARWVEIRR